MAFYEDFSQVYDGVMDQALYEKWLAFTQRHLPAQTRSIFELACGSGALSVRLAQLGFAVTGLDISEDMLTLAAKKAADIGVKIALEQGDMRLLGNLGTFDAVTCYSDSLCYLADLNEWKMAVDGVFRLLKVGGVFIFDVHSVKKIHDFDGFSYHENAEDFAFLWDSFAGNKPHSVVHELSFFISDGNGKFIRKDEVHEERTYEIAKILSVLTAFAKIEVYADFTDDAPDENAERWFFVCRK